MVWRRFSPAKTECAQSLYVVAKMPSITDGESLMSRTTGLAQVQQHIYNCVDVKNHFVNSLFFQGMNQYFFSIHHS